MKITVVQKQIQALPADALIVGLVEGTTAPAGYAAAVDTALGGTDGQAGDGAISKLLRLGDFRGKLNETAVLYTNGLIPAPRVILVGLGPREELNADRVRQACGTAARKARDLDCPRVASLVLGSAVGGGLDARTAAQVNVEGALLGTYQFREHKSSQGNGNGKRIDELALVEFNAARLAAISAGARDGEIIANATNTARTLINRAPNVANPRALADFAQEMAGRAGLKCTVLTEREIAEQRMGGVLAVSQGSANPPRFVILEHDGGDGVAAQAPANTDPLVFVGKGVTFDSGGISLKDPQGMESMKADMSGAAAVIGALQAIGELKLPRRVIGLVPLVENMPGGHSYRPSDVLTMMSGLTVEVVSTDAEGRLILADALHYAKRYEPAGVIDLATLTGACVVALGEGMAAGLFANDERWAARILESAERSGERMWRMPLFAEYGDKIKSDYADIKNGAGRTSGIGTSAYFLKRFAESKPGRDAYPWAHVDMAAMMFSSENRGYQPKGAMGYGVRTLVELAKDMTPQV
jgi:leucyl aminopeptidase